MKNQQQKIEKVPRSTEEMVDALKRQVRLLRDFAQKAFIDGNADYAGEIATKLRLLVTKFGSNKPLLLQLMDETGIHPKIILGGPPGIPFSDTDPTQAGDEITLEKFLNLPAGGVRVPSGEFIIMSKVVFIRALSEQAGGAHEDWAMGEDLATFLSQQIYVMGLHSSLAELRTSVDAVLSVADRFIAEFDARSTRESAEKIGA